MNDQSKQKRLVESTEKMKKTPQESTDPFQVERIANSLTTEEVKTDCRTCLYPTNHSRVFFSSIPVVENEVDAVYELWRCKGCSTHVLSEHSIDHIQIPPERTQRVFSPRTTAFNTKTLREIPHGVPNEICRLWRDICLLAAYDRFDSIGILLRCVTEKALKNRMQKLSFLEPDMAKSGNLVDLLIRSAENYLISETMAARLHALRGFGNDRIHDPLDSYCHYNTKIHLETVNDFLRDAFAVEPVGQEHGWPDISSAFSDLTQSLSEVALESPDWQTCSFKTIFASHVDDRTWTDSKKAQLFALTYQKALDTNFPGIQLAEKISNKTRITLSSLSKHRSLPSLRRELLKKDFRKRVIQLLKEEIFITWPRKTQFKVPGGKA